MKFTLIAIMSFIATSIVITLMALMLEIDSVGIQDDEIVSIWDARKVKPVEFSISESYTFICYISLPQPPLVNYAELPKQSYVEHSTNNSTNIFCDSKKSNCQNSFLQSINLGEIALPEFKQTKIMANVE